MWASGNHLRGRGAAPVRTWEAATDYGRIDDEVLLFLCLPLGQRGRSGICRAARGGEHSKCAQAWSQPSLSLCFQKRSCLPEHGLAEGPQRGSWGAVLGHPRAWSPGNPRPTPPGAEVPPCSTLNPGRHWAPFGPFQEAGGTVRNKLLVLVSKSLHTPHQFPSLAPLGADEHREVLQGAHEARAIGKLRAPLLSWYGPTRGQPRRRCWGRMGDGPCLSVPGGGPGCAGGHCGELGRERQDPPAARAALGGEGAARPGEEEPRRVGQTLFEGGGDGGGRDTR